MAAKQTSRLNVRMDPESARMLAELASRDGLSVSAYLRRAIREIWLKSPPTGTG